jgi:hypothetical protein
MRFRSILTACFTEGTTRRMQRLVAPALSETKDGQWGSAFLFASSAEVLQCQLDAGFPQVKGRCQGADGRKFDLGPTLKP